MLMDMVHKLDSYALVHLVCDGLGLLGIRRLLRLGEQIVCLSFAQRAVTAMKDIACQGHVERRYVARRGQEQEEKQAARGEMGEAGWAHRDVLALAGRGQFLTLVREHGIPCAIMVQIACILHVRRHAQADVAVHDVEHRLVQQLEGVTDIVCSHLWVVWAVGYR